MPLRTGRVTRYREPLPPRVRLPKNDSPFPTSGGQTFAVRTESDAEDLADVSFRDQGPKFLVIGRLRRLHRIPSNSVYQQDAGKERQTLDSHDIRAHGLVRGR